MFGSAGEQVLFVPAASEQLVEDPFCSVLPTLRLFQTSVDG